jgi:hypothetical protein
MASKPPARGGFLFIATASHLIRVFNMSVENSVEKAASILVSDSSRYASALCTGARAGTMVA